MEFPILGLILVCLWQHLTCLPVPESEDDEENIRQLLMDLHYMGPESPFEGGAQALTHESFTQALKNYQDFFGLEVTGEMDSATLNLMRSARCSMPDVASKADYTKKRKRRYALHGSSWDTNKLSYKVKSFNRHLSEEKTEEIMRTAFDHWSRVTNMDFDRLDRYDSRRADLDVEFVRGEHGDWEAFDGPGRTLAHAFFPYFGGDIHYDDDEFWTDGRHDGINFLNTATHEIGHSLGLSHSNVPEAVMYPYIHSYKPQGLTLHPDDVEGIRQIYGFRSDNPNPPVPTMKVPPSSPPTVRRDPTTTTTTTTPAPPPRPEDPDLPDYCNTGKFDTITRTHDGKTYAFRGAFYFEIDPDIRVGVVGQKKTYIGDGWGGLYHNLDASLYWPPREEWVNGRLVTRPGETYFFKDHVVLKYVNQEFRGWGFMSDWFPGVPRYLDAAFVWNGNGKTYFIKGDQFYRLSSNDIRQKLDNGYPRPMSVWTDVFAYGDIDAVFQYDNKRTYFFKDNNYYKYDDRAGDVFSSYPRSTTLWWMGCNIGGRLNLNQTDVRVQSDDDGRFDKVDPDTVVDADRNDMMTDSPSSSACSPGTCPGFISCPGYISALAMVLLTLMKRL